MNSPLVWYGGKGMMAPHITRWFPPHHTFVDVFGGGASVLLAKPPSPVDVYNDIDGGLVNFWRVVRDPVQFAELERLCHATPYSREQYLECQASWRDEADPVVRAWAFFVAVRQSFSGLLNKTGWKHNIAESRLGKAQSVSGWLGAIDMLPAIHERLRTVQVDHRDWSVILTTYDTPDTLFYCDPPYLPGARVDAAVYQHEMAANEHFLLVTRLQSLTGMVVLSGYVSPMYIELESEGWERHDFEWAAFTQNARSSGGVKARRTESVWLNPAAVAAWERHSAPLFAEVLP